MWKFVKFLSPHNEFVFMVRVIHYSEHTYISQDSSPQSYSITRLRPQAGKSDIFCTHLWPQAWRLKSDWLATLVCVCVCGGFQREHKQLFRTGYKGLKKVHSNLKCIKEFWFLLMEPRKTSVIGRLLCQSESRRFLTTIVTRTWWNSLWVYLLPVSREDYHQPHFRQYDIKQYYCNVLLNCEVTLLVNI